MAIREAERLQNEAPETDDAANDESGDIDILDEEHQNNDGLQ